MSENHETKRKPSSFSRRLASLFWSDDRLLPENLLRLLLMGAVAFVAAMIVFRFHLSPPRPEGAGTKAPRLSGGIIVFLAAFCVISLALSLARIPRLVLVLGVMVLGLSGIWVLSWLYQYTFHPFDLHMDTRPWFWWAVLSTGVATSLVFLRTTLTKGLASGRVCLLLGAFLVSGIWLVPVKHNFVKAGSDHGYGAAFPIRKNPDSHTYEHRELDTKERRTSSLLVLPAIARGRGFISMVMLDFIAEDHMLDRLIERKPSLPVYQLLEQRGRRDTLWRTGMLGYYLALCLSFLAMPLTLLFLGAGLRSKKSPVRVSWVAAGEWFLAAVLAVPAVFSLALTYSARLLEPTSLPRTNWPIWITFSAQVALAAAMFLAGWLLGSKEKEQESAAVSAHLGEDGD